MNFVTKRINELATPDTLLYESVNGNEFIDVREILSRHKTNILWSNYRFDTQDPALKELFDSLRDNNDLLQLFKGMERYLSKDGKCYLVYDVFQEGEMGFKEKTAMIYLAVQHPRNQTVRFFQQKEIMGTVVIQPTSVNNGVRQQVVQLRTLDETETRLLENGVATQGVPIDNFWTTTPDVLKPYTQGIFLRQHNYGVLSIKEMLNRNIIDIAGQQDKYLPDDAAVTYVAEMINAFLVFIKKEQLKNSTRIMGTFNSFADIFDTAPDAAEMLYAAKEEGMNKSMQQIFLEQQNKKRTVLQDDYIVATRSAQVTMDKLQSTFSMTDMMNGLTALLEVYFNASGFDYTVQTISGASQYTSTSEIQTQNKRTSETIKEALVLRQTQITDVINKLIDMWFGKVDAWKQYVDKWEFKVVSNIVNEEAYSVEKIILMKENGLISKELAIEKANKDLSENDLEELIKVIEKEEKEQEDKEMKLMQQGDNSFGGGDE